MKIICIADTHGLNSHMYYELKDSDADVIIHAGDFCNYGTLDDAKAFNEIFSELPMKYKIVVAGNHDFAMIRGYKFTKDIIYLQDSSTTIEYPVNNLDPDSKIISIKFYGSPWSSLFYDWAFMLDYDGRKAQWAKIPKDVDVLITHSPPFGTLDYVNGRNEGCEALANRLKELSPKVHIFGHLHEGYGEVYRNNTHYINCSMLGERGFNTPIEFNI